MPIDCVANCHLEKCLTVDMPPIVVICKCELEEKCLISSR